MTAYIELFIRGNVRGEMSGYLITITIMTSPQNIASTIQVLLRLHLDNNSNKKKSPFTFFRYLGLENLCGVWWLIGRFDASRPKRHGFDSRSSRHVETLGKSFTRSCLWCFGVKLRHSIRAALGAPPSSIGLEEAL